MRTNGYLYYPTSATAPTFNDDGVPVTTSQHGWSDAVPCHIRTVSSTSNGRYEDGTFHQASFEVLTERNTVPLDTQKVKLERSGKTLGEFQVQGMPEEISLDRIKIVV